MGKPLVGARHRGDHPSPAALLLIAAGIVALPGRVARGGDYQWAPAPSNNGLWSDTANWVDPATGKPIKDPDTGEAIKDPLTGFEESFPCLAYDLAILGYSNTPNITLDSNRTIDSIALGGGSGTQGPPSIFTNGSILNLAGAGFIGNPYSTSGPTQGTIAVTGPGALMLWNAASAWVTGIDNYSTLAFFNQSTAADAVIHNYGNLRFGDAATGANATITNVGWIGLDGRATLGASATVLDNQGSIDLSGFASAGGERIRNGTANSVSFSGRSTAWVSDIQNFGSVLFRDAANAGSSHLANYDRDAAIRFRGAADAGAVAIDNYTGTTSFGDVSSAGRAAIWNGGDLRFFGSAGSGSASITNLSTGGVTFEDQATAGHAVLHNSGTIEFTGFATAGSGTITSENTGGGTLVFAGQSSAGEATIVSDGQRLTFRDNASAGAAVITNKGNTGWLHFDAGSTAGQARITNDAELWFNDQSTAGRATIVNNRELYFTGSAGGGMATVTNGSAAITDVSGVALGTFTLGAIQGEGEWRLGRTNLSVGGLGTSTTVSGAILDGGTAGGTGGALTKTGAGTLTLTGNNSYTGGTTIRGGMIVLTDVGSLEPGGDLTFDGNGTFQFRDTTSSAEPQGTVFGALSFASGDGTVQSTYGYGAVGSANILFYGPTPRSTGATGNFLTTGGVNGDTNNIYVGDGSSGIFNPNSGLDSSHFHAPGFMDRGIFFGGDTYASIDARGYVRGVDYGVDPDSVSSPGGETITGSPSSVTNVRITGAITHQATAAINTLNLGANTLALDPGQVLTLNGIIGSGGAAIVTGGTLRLGSGSDLVIRVARAGDTLTIDSDVVDTAVITKSGAGMLAINGDFHGEIRVNGGGMAVGGILRGNVNVDGEGAFKVGQGGTVHGTVTASGNHASLGGAGQIDGGIVVGNGAASYPGDPVILTAATAEYLDGSTAEFAVAARTSGTTPPVAGVDYDRIQLTSGSAEALKIHSGTTSLRINFMPDSLAQAQANAAAGIFDSYFFFTLGEGTSSGRFTTLVVTDGTNSYSADFVGDVATIGEIGLGFTVSYFANATAGTTVGGNDVSITFVPEPAALLLVLAGIPAFLLPSRTRSRNLPRSRSRRATGPSVLGRRRGIARA